MSTDAPDPRDQPARAPAPDDAARLRALIALAEALAAAQSVDALVEVIAEEALRASGAASLSVSRWERDRDVLRTLINVGELGPGEVRHPPDETYGLEEYPVATELLRRGQPYVITESDNTDPASVALLRRLGKGSQLGVPIMASGRTWGELWATTRRGEPTFGRPDVQVLEAIAQQVGVAVERGELLEQVSALASRDPLTGTANRRAVDEAARAAIAGRRSGGTGVALLLVDLDGLKAINDGAGHDAGDRAIIQLARALEDAAAEAPSALVGRLGGDEFCVLLPGADEDTARRIGRRTCELLSHAAPELSVSCGVAAVAGGGRSLTDLLKVADRELYAVKHRRQGWAGSLARLTVPPALARAAAATGRAGRRRLRDRE